MLSYFWHVLFHHCRDQCQTILDFKTQKFFVSIVIREIFIQLRFYYKKYIHLIHSLDGQLKKSINNMNRLLGDHPRTFQRKHTDFRARPHFGGWDRGRQSRLAHLRNQHSRHFSHIDLDRYGERLRRFPSNRTSPQEWRTYGSYVSLCQKKKNFLFTYFSD